MTVDPQSTLLGLGEELRTSGWELAVETVEEGLREDVIPSLVRLGRVAQLGDLPTFIAELGRQVQEPQPARMRIGGPLAALARDHAREREALGFAPREVITEFLLLRRVIWRFVADRVAALTGDDLLEVERRLNDAIDRLIVECTAAYFDRATDGVAEHARNDPLTGLLNHQAFRDLLDVEIGRSARYDHNLTIVFLDVDHFKGVNELLGHAEGDRVLHRLGALASSMLRGSDVGGHLGEDEFAILLLEADKHAGDRFLRRFRDGIERLRGCGDLPPGLEVSAGCAHFPSEAVGADELLRLADARQQEAKRARLF